MFFIVAINGAGTSGKDTFIDLFEDVCREQTDMKVKVARYSSVDIVKQYATVLGWDGVKDDKGRRFLSDIKDALIRYNDAPFKYIQNKVSEFRSSCVDEDASGVIFFHIREPKELSKVASNLGATTLLILRGDVSPDSFTNHADKDVLSFSYDFVIPNDGSMRDLRMYAEAYFHYLKTHLNVDWRDIDAGTKAGI